MKKIFLLMLVPFVFNNIVSGYGLEVLSVEIFDVVGRKLLSHTSLTSHSSPLIEIDISHLENGMYFLKIQTDDGMVTKKIVKQ